MKHNPVLKPGDVLVLPDDAGCWSRAFEFVAFDSGEPGAMLVRDRATGESFRARPGLLRRPAIATEAEPIERKSDMMTDAQRRMLFSRARALGMGLDDLRAATPRGSVSALTKTEARDLIDRLASKADCPWTGQGTATGKQLGTIEYLRKLVGFSDAEFSEWLTRRFKVGSLREVTNKPLASRIIGGLSKMRANRIAGPEGGQGGHCPRRPGAGIAG